MNERVQWINRQVKTGYILLVFGVIVAAAGILYPFVVKDPGFNTRIITGIGIVLLGIGISKLVVYASARKDPKTAARLASTERDERIRLIRAQAGLRAYWVSTGLAYALLMWVSFAENGSLPPLTGDGLWVALATVVVLPFIMFAASQAYDQARN